MSTTVDATLYHAGWCGHCKHFKPEWAEYKKKIATIGGKHNGINLTTHEYEDRELPEDGARINGEPIKGFPTVKITVTKNGKTTEIDYEGKRNSKELFYYVTERAHLE